MSEWTGPSRYRDEVNEHALGEGALRISAGVTGRGVADHLVREWVELGVRLGLEAAANRCEYDDFGGDNEHGGFGERFAESIRAVDAAAVLRKEG